MTFFSTNPNTIWNGLFIAGAALATLAIAIGAVITHVA